MFIEEDHPLAATWVRIPVLIGLETRTRPLVLTSDPSGAVAVCKMYNHWAGAQIRYELHEPAARAWTSFLNYLFAAHSRFPLQGNDVNHLVAAFLLVRHSGTAAAHSSKVQRLRWKPASYNVVKRELILIESILRLASSELRYIDLGLVRFKKHEVSKSIDSLHRLVLTAPAQLTDDFFLHLRAARMRWAEVHGRHEVQLPAVIRRQEPSKIVWSCFSTDELWELVAREQNPMFRALWLAGGFGGPRISEQLNAFQIDILPPSARSVLFPGFEEADDNTILYLRAHPALSKYTGSLSSFSMTRREYLSSRYGLLPRTEMRALPQWRGYAAGWKGTVPSGEHGLHQVMWCNDDAALAFANCMVEINDIHRRHKTSLRHPWLYVNVGGTKDFGEPIKMSRIKKAFAATCLRAGIPPYKFGRNLHGLRHHYVYVLDEELKLDSKHIQIAMGHASIHSQRDYTMKLKMAHSALRNRVVQ